MNIVRVTFCHPKHLEDKAREAAASVEKTVRDNFRIQCELYVLIQANPLPAEFPSQDIICTVVCSGPAARDKEQVRDCAVRVATTLCRKLDTPVRALDIADYRVPAPAALP